MISASAVAMRGEMGGGGGGGDEGELEDELDALLGTGGAGARRRGEDAGERERELNMFRSGSAPPTIEGSLNAISGLLRGGGEAAVTVAAIPDAETLNGHGGLLSEDELRADPAYLSYYYSHGNLNPRLPPPVLSKEDWRSTQRLKAGVVGGIGDRRKVSPEETGHEPTVGRPVFSQNVGFDQEEAARNDVGGAAEWVDGGGDGLIGLSLGRQRSFADILQDNIGRRTPASEHPSRAVSRNSFLDNQELLNSADSQYSMHNDILEAQRAVGNVQNVSGLPSINASASQTFASVLGSSISRNATPDSHYVPRVPSPGLPPVGVRINSNEKKLNCSSSFNTASSKAVEPDDILAAISNMNMSKDGTLGDSNSISQSKFQSEISDHQNISLDPKALQVNKNQHSLMLEADTDYLGIPPISQPSNPSFSDINKNVSGLANIRNSTNTRIDGHAEMQRSSTLSTRSYQKSPTSSNASPGGSPAQHQNIDNINSAFLNYGLGGYPLSPGLPSMMMNCMGSGNMPPLFESAAAASAIASFGADSRNLGNNILSSPTLSLSDVHNLGRTGNQTATGLLSPLSDPFYVQYLKATQHAAQGTANCSDPSLERGFMGSQYGDLTAVQKAYIEALLQQQKQYGMPLGKSTTSNHGYYGNLAFGMGMAYPGSPLGSPVASPSGPGSPLRLSERNMRFPSNLRNLGGWNSDPSGYMNDNFPSSLLDEFKSNKARSFELAEIASHVVEFSADQYGSRFIQQKLETATVEEKDMVFKEIMPQALSLMTDVFGNYVVQKFFEHGSAAQRRELADQLFGHVLALSLQMYGCRVIQKAIEVVDLDQKTKMVTELDGHIMRCVRDQNGNHVIQKCIECVPEDSIQFIISTFYGQVVPLSTHPYGCRVIQRVLEHCTDPKTQEIVMDEILQSVCMLAQDQYGNYVVQHVLEHGKPHERSVIIEKLAGQIIQMSQQKFASNVVEKCLTFGGPAEREVLINEMLGTTDENEPLQAMMKDQFGNYVVQKVLETCDDQQRELILSRVKVHLSALKKYTYGKHIVARVEKLVAAGERRIGLQAQYPS